jgi:hypothetical protein
MTVLFGTATAGVAQTSQMDHSMTMNHSVHMRSATPGGVLLTEPGQGAFAALSEVVSVLEADPETDWSNVDLGTLRDHLVDMDRLVSNTVVKEIKLPDGIRAVATGDVETISSLRRMVPAHAAELGTDDRWTVAVSEDDESVTLTVTSDDPAVVARIKGLGFFGLMASQDHHRGHHLMMASGEDPHRHLDRFDHDRTATIESRPEGELRSTAASSRIAVVRAVCGKYQAHHDPGEHAHVTPALPTIIQGLRRSIRGRCIRPT